MRICWDNLENIKYCRENGKWFKILRNNRKKYYEYTEKCRGCGEPFLSNVSSRGLYCCISCARTGKNNPMYGKHLSEETKKKMSEMRKDENHPNWKGGVTKRNLPLYDTYAPKIEWCEEVRRNAEEPNILEVKCTHCGKWFIPTMRSVCNRVNVLNRTNNGYKGEQRFYCSKGCKEACPLYGKTPQTLMKEDAVRAGRLEWLEMNREVQPELRQMVLERDEYKCRKCGATDKPLHCHHIYPVSINPIESADIDNCMTLCADCHKEVHQKDGCKYGQLRMDIC
jgi:hypothetical protein